MSLFEIESSDGRTRSLAAASSGGRLWKRFGGGSADLEQSAWSGSDRPLQTASRQMTVNVIQITF